MTVNVADRPIEIVKEEVIDILVHNYSHGVISSEAFERRLDVVVAATSAIEMTEQVKDLDMQLDEKILQEKERQFAINYSDKPTEESDWLISVMGGAERSGCWDVPKNLYLISIMGGAEVDFTDARFSSGPVNVYSFTLMGGNKMYVPENINVVCKAFSLCGGVSNKTPSMGGINAPSIVVKGFNMFGGTEIKLKQTIKEKFVAFANQMKATFNSK